jgi:hypothetical protein
MVSVLIGWMVVGLIVAVLAAALLSTRTRSSSRDARSLVVTTAVEGRPATVVRARAGLLPGAAVLAYLALFVLVLGLTVTHDLGLAFFLPLAAWQALAAYFIGSGRVGDRTIVLAPDSLTQRAAGVEQSVRWADITSVEPNKQGLDLLADDVEVRRLVPALWTGRTRRPRQGVRVQLGDLHPQMDLTCGLLTWIDEPWSRGELGTADAVDRLVGPR